MKSLLASLCLALALIASTTGMPALGAGSERLSNEDRERLLDLLGRAVRFDPGAQPPDVLIGGLRMLRDPTLRPVFAKLAKSDIPGMRMHGALGLAETDEQRGLNTALLREVENPLEQTSLFSQAARLGHIHERHLVEILSWEPLAPDLEAAALQRSLAMGIEIDAERARRLAGHESIAVALMGGLLLLELELSDEAVASFDRFFELPPDMRRPIAGMLLQHIRRESMRRTGPFVERVRASAAGDELLQIEATHSLLHVDPERGVPHWLRMYESSADAATRLMLAMSALQSAAPTLSPLFERLVIDASDSELLADIGRAGLALASENGRAEALVVLTGHGHGPTCQWLVGHAEELPTDVAAPALLAVIRTADGVGAQRPEVRSASVGAAAILAERAPESLAGELRDLAGRRNEAMCQSLLVGALRSHAASASFLPADLNWPGRQSRTLAELAAARFGDLSAPGHRENLRAIALGRAGLPEVFRVQAAWLAVQAVGDGEGTVRTLLEANR